MAGIFTKGIWQPYICQPKDPKIRKKNWGAKRGPSKNLGGHCPPRPPLRTADEHVPFSNLRNNRQGMEPSQPALVARAVPTVPPSWYRPDVMTENKILVLFHNYFVIEKVQWQLLVVNRFLKI